MIKNYTKERRKYKTRQGVHPSEETKNKIRKALAGRKPSVATMEAALKASYGNRNRLGKHHSPESRQKISEALKGKRMGSQSHRWKGGENYDKDGYVLSYFPNHPRANVKGYILKHRLIMERHLGRILLDEEIVHHNNNVRDDNRLENLSLFPSQKEHRQFHAGGNLK